MVAIVILTITIELLINTDKLTTGYHNKLITVMILIITVIIVSLKAIVIIFINIKLE